MRFYNHKSSALYEVYLKVFEGDLDLEKKTYLKIIIGWRIMVVESYSNIKNMS